MRTGAWKFTSMTWATSDGVSRAHRRALRDAGVVDEAVDAAERVPRFEHDLLGALEVAEVGHPIPRVRRMAPARRRARSAAGPRAARSARRLRPRAASSSASAAPMPDDAPVTRMREPSICTRVSWSGGRASAVLGAVRAGSPVCDWSNASWYSGGAPQVLGDEHRELDLHRIASFVRAARRRSRRATRRGRRASSRRVDALPEHEHLGLGWRLRPVVGPGLRLLAHVERPKPRPPVKTSGRKTRLTVAVPAR